MRQVQSDQLLQGELLAKEKRGLSSGPAATASSGGARAKGSSGPLAPEPPDTTGWPRGCDSSAHGDLT